MQPTDDNLRLFRAVLLQWYEHNSRDYPWRHNRTSYRTAIAELMLRRTRADQVVAVFEAFLRRFPSLRAAALADAEEIRRILYPLGLAWRAEGVVAFVRAAYQQYGDELPVDVEKLRSLPAVGDYVAAAIACFAGDQPMALIDTNVVRVLGRVFGLRTDGEARRRKDMRELAARAVHFQRTADYHYAMLDFGARVCGADSPRCEICPLSRGGNCHFFETERQLREAKPCP